MEENEVKKQNQSSFDRFLKIVMIVVVVGSLIAIVTHVLSNITKSDSEQETIDISLPLLEYNKETRGTVYIIDPVTYEVTQTTTRAIYQEFDESKNLVVTEDWYKDKYIVVTGHIDEIHEDNFYLHDHPWYYYHIDNVNKDTIFSLSKEELVTLVGIITDADYLFTSIDLLEVYTEEALQESGKTAITLHFKQNVK